MKVTATQLSNPYFRAALIFKGHLENAVRPLVYPGSLEARPIIKVEQLSETLQRFHRSSYSLWMEYDLHMPHGSPVTVEIRDSRNRPAAIALSGHQLWELSDGVIRRGGERSFSRHLAEDIALQLYRFLADSHRVNPHEIDVTVKL